MRSIKLIYRKKRPEFNSIENVFDTLLPYLSAQKVELPFFSKGFSFRKKNIQFVKSLEADVLHVTGNDHYLLLGLKKRKAILTIHDIEILKRTRGIKRFILKKLWFDIPIKNASLVTTISKFSKQEIEALGDYKTPIKVIYNPLTLPVNVQTFTEPRRGKIKILHIGTKSNKNLDRLIDALSEIDCELKIIGALTTAQEHRLVANSIDYTAIKNLSNDEMIAAYHEADLLAFISTYEGFGLPIIEAQACGTPVLTSNVASMPEIAGDAAIFVDPYNQKEIQEAIANLISNDILRKELVAKGYENIKRFEAQHIANEYQKLYQELTREA